MRSPASRGRTYKLAVLAALAAAALVCGVVGVITGPSGQPLGVVADVLADGARSLFTGADTPASPAHLIVLDIRLPRMLLACLVGAALAIAGAIMQALFQNPMADPYIVGVSGGAALGAVAAMMLGIDIAVGAFSAVTVLAFVGALTVTGLVYVLSQRGGRVHTTTLLLTGVAVGSLAAAFTSLLMLSRDDLQSGAIFWLLGSLSGRNWSHVGLLVPPLVVGLGAAMLFARPLNVLLLGDEAATTIGLDVNRMKRGLLVLASLLAASAVAVSGIIGFVGLIVPHICRLLVGPDHRILIPTSALGGALLMVLADIPARLLIAPAELPIGVVTSILGCPFFLYLLRCHGAGRA